MKFSACFLIIFLALGAVMGLLYVPPSALPKFETAFSEALPLYQPSRNAWGRAEYALFGQGRKGVVVGQNGWLYTEEEFTCPRGWQQNLQHNLDYVDSVRMQFQQRNVQLYIVLIPAKARIETQFALPGCRINLYAQAQQAMNVDEAQLQLVQFMHSDTHWSPTGAAAIANLIATHYTIEPHTIFTLQQSELRDYSGDLLRYLPGVAWPSERVAVSTLTAVTSLVDNEAPPVVLIGTSYSANPQWGFEDALKLALQADVLNKADAGLGPFKVMQNYLSSHSWQQQPPKLVIWEIPERYLVLSP